MIKKSTWTLLITFSLISFLSCTKEENEQSSEDTPTISLPEHGIAIENAWARPARANGVSAIYMNVLNGSARADTLLSLSSPVAGLVEVHESYEREEGMMGMRQAETVIFPARDVVILEPGGLHIMLIQLREELAEGDTVEVTLQLSDSGEMVISAPVQPVD